MSEANANRGTAPVHRFGTPAMRYAMTNKWLKEIGLFSWKQRWSELASLRRTALSPLL